MIKICNRLRTPNELWISFSPRKKFAFDSFEQITYIFITYEHLPTYTVLIQRIRNTIKPMAYRSYLLISGQDIINKYFTRLFATLTSLQAPQQIPSFKLYKKGICY